MKYLRKPAPARPADGGGEDPASTLAREMYPALVEFLCESRWDDGSVRVPGTMTLFTEDGAWKVCLSDKDAGLIAFVTSVSPEGVLDAAEKGLQGGSLDWRKQRPQGGRGRRN